MGLNMLQHPGIVTCLDDREAPYEASRITEFQEKTNGANAACAAGWS